MRNIIKLNIIDSSQVFEARWLAAQAATDLGFNETDKGRIAIIVTELTGNLIKHALKGCEFHLYSGRKSDGSPTLEMLAIDKGPGIRDLRESLRDGFSTAGSPGTGLGSVNRLSDAFDIYSEVTKGTVVYACVEAKKNRSKVPDPAYDIAGINLAMTGQEVSGDKWDYQINGGQLRIIVADGLGHGPDASRASLEAIKAFETSKQFNLVETMGRLHEAMRHTRGAAVALTEINPQKHQLQYCAVGNIAAMIIVPGASKKLISQNGIVGFEMKKVSTLEYEWKEDSLLVLHSDGLATRWNLENYPGILNKLPMIICGVLYRDFLRGNDDVTIIALRKNSE